MIQGWKEVKEKKEIGAQGSNKCRDTRYRGRTQRKYWTQEEEKGKGRKETIKEWRMEGHKEDWKKANKDGQKNYWPKAMTEWGRENEAKEDKAMMKRRSLGVIKLN